MKLLFSVHLYPPTHNCGGEYFVHGIAKYMISKGHQVRVLLHQAVEHDIKDTYVYEGVEVFPPTRNVDTMILWADLVLTHLGYTRWTIDICRIYKRPCVFVSHNTAHYAEVAFSDKTGVVYNCNAMAKELKYANPSIVLHPVIDASKYDINNDAMKSEYITMVNLDDNKGGRIFKRIAEALPKRKFMAVQGSYSEPSYMGQATDMPSNVTIVKNNPNILSVYKKTRILLMLSLYESWGMTATEAMANGIPVICTPTPGLKENCGEAGIFVPKRKELPDENIKLQLYDTGRRHEIYDCDSYDIAPVITAIKKLDNKKVYADYSERSQCQAAAYDSQKELVALEQFFLSLIDKSQV